MRPASPSSKPTRRAAESAGDIRVHPFYHEARNEIVQPGHFVACSRYFVQKWAPRLGGTGVCMILYLRSLGYYNPLTGERRDGIQVSLKQIAGACGCSDRTIQRELEQNEWLQQFVQVEPCYHRTPDGRVQRLENIYRIAMDDPVAPEDEDRLAQLLTSRTAPPGGPAPSHSVPSAPAPRAPVSLSPTAPSSSEGPDPEAPPRSRRRTAPEADNLTPPPRQSDAGLPTECPGRNSPDILSPQASIPARPTEELPEHQEPAPPRAAEVPADSSVVAALYACGVTRKTARELAARHPARSIEAQIAALPYRTARDPAAALVKAIVEDWALPAAFTAAQQEREAEKQHAERARRAAARREEEARAQEGQAAALAACWTSLNEDERQEIEAACREALRRQSPFLCRLLESGVRSQAVQQMLDQARDGILRSRLAGEPQGPVVLQPGLPWQPGCQGGGAVGFRLSHGEPDGAPGPSTPG